MSGLKRRQKIVVAVTAVGVLCVVAYFMFLLPKTEVEQDGQPHNEFVQQIETLQAQPLPADPVQRAVHYAQLGQNYEGLYDFKLALESYLQAQAVIDKDNLQQQVVYYEDIARAYKELGDTVQAKIYLQKQKSHLQAFLDNHPEDETTRNAITRIDGTMSNF